MPVKITAEFSPLLRDVLGRFKKMEDEFTKQAVIELSPLMEKFVQFARGEAPKATGAYAQSIRGWLVQEQKGLVEARAGGSSPLGTFIKGGTRPHTILGKPFLSFFWPNGPKGPGNYVFRSVRHPGTQANPYHERAFAKWLPEAEKALKNMAASTILFLTHTARAPGA